ncbi:hypothetical protein Sme01_21490 [Sphaerisporangium melleum]|uniref:DUF742 domain-containing protein n=1 Tax=Sphaerisporangium melleum TaxID=321316 RepID=A0A917VHX6_9ACTN|nr:DUF742 domain-containing protein [Sphaerisporangium melleum]GGK79661.1 hypothetical protein GCM10007964_22890 [Sphaerisporangium melleum]GII69673.1 hypothetical protein Sme01_21490 [Sphaerisporangium melleum]
MSEGERWLDQDAGPLIRPYTVTRGRTRPTGPDFDMVAIVRAMPGVVPQVGLGPEHLRLLRMCAQPMSVVDLASESGLSLSVVRVLLGDLRDHELVSVRPPATVSQLPEERLLREVIQGLKAL